MLEIKIIIERTCGCDLLYILDFLESTITKTYLLICEGVSKKRYINKLNVFLQKWLSQIYY